MLCCMMLDVDVFTHISGAASASSDGLPLASPSSFFSEHAPLNTGDIANMMNTHQFEPGTVSMHDNTSHDVASCGPGWTTLCIHGYM